MDDCLAAAFAAVGIMARLAPNSSYDVRRLV